jgi:hypothetical protein
MVDGYQCLGGKCYLQHQDTRNNDPEDHNSNLLCHENLKSVQPFLLAYQWLTRERRQLLVRKYDFIMGSYYLPFVLENSTAQWHTSFFL